jgi:hypothetical protein
MARKLLRLADGCRRVHTTITLRALYQLHEPPPPALPSFAAGEQETTMDIKHRTKQLVATVALAGA